MTAKTWKRGVLGKENRKKKRREAQSGLVFWALGVSILCLTGVQLDWRHSRLVHGTGISESSWRSQIFMNESEERTGIDPLSASIQLSTKRSLPVSRGATRSGATSQTTVGRLALAVAKRHPLGPSAPRPASLHAEELEAIGALEAEYKLAIPPYYFSLIDPDDPHDPIRLQSVTSPLESRTRPASSWKTRSRRTRTRPCRA